MFFCFLTSFLFPSFFRMCLLFFASCDCKVVFNDSPWLRGRVRPEALRYVHPFLDLPTCRSLEIANVSDVVEEQLEEGFQPEYCNTYGDEPARFSVSPYPHTSTLSTLSHFHPFYAHSHLPHLTSPPSTLSNFHPFYPIYPIYLFSLSTLFIFRFLLPSHLLLSIYITKGIVGVEGVSEWHHMYYRTSQRSTRLFAQ